MKRRLLELVVLSAGTLAFCSFLFLQDSEVTTYRDLLTPASGLTYLVFGLPMLAILGALLRCRGVSHRLFWAAALASGLGAAGLIWLMGASPSTSHWPLWRQGISITVLWAIATAGFVLPVEAAWRLASALDRHQNPGALRP